MGQRGRALLWCHQQLIVCFSLFALVSESAHVCGTPWDRAEAEQKLVTSVTVWPWRLLSPSPFVSVCWCSEIPVSPQQTVPLQERPGMSVDRSAVRWH